MSAFANLPISRKLAAAFAAVVAVIFASGAVIYSQLGVIEEATHRLLQTDRGGEALGEMMKATLRQQSGLRGYLLTGEERFLERYRDGRDGFMPALREAKRL